jgi:diguanylate cyclase (GGDEF)-like protein
MSMFGRMRSVVVYYLPKYTIPEQVACIAENATQSLIGHVCVTLFVLFEIYGTSEFMPAVPWGIIMLLGAIPTLRLFKKFDGASKFNLPEMASMSAAIAGLRGLFWSIGVVNIMPHVGEHLTTVLEIVMLGMLIGGTVNYWALPLAALTYSAVIVIGAVIAIFETQGYPAGMPIAALMVAAFVFFNRMALVHTRDLRLKIVTMRRLKDEQSVVSLLLREFEEDARDWLWKIDKNGVLVRGFDNFVAALGCEVDNLHSKPLHALFTQYAVNCYQKNLAEIFGKSLADDTPFTDYEISIGEASDTVYLSLTAKPDFGADGKKIGWHGVCTDISEARKAEASMRHMAMSDTLTNLPNRATLRDRLAQIIQNDDGIKRYVVYGDLDSFKRVNDVKGHAAGDAVLLNLARRFSSILRPTEMVARIGGDEFVFVLDRRDEEIEFAWREIVKAANEPVNVEGQPQWVGISLGIVALENDVKSVDEILRRADLALYNSKQQGRGTARYYTAEMDIALAKRQMLETALRAAVAEKRFEMYYQPIFTCSTRQLCGYEALIRWQDATHGDGINKQVDPDIFIPLAEECGLINEIGAWALHKACHDARNFPAGISVSINISALQMRSRRLLAVVTNALADSGLAPDLLELEMTETAFADKSGLAESIASDLKELGIHLALDDFGTGYSSLSYLHRFKFDRIKIDRSFIQAYSTNEVSRALVNAILALAHQLNISITAEGIETEEQFVLMAKQGMDCAQGFLLGKPQPLRKLIAQINTQADVA